MNDYQLRFLQQSVLGQSVNINDPKAVIKRCVELADKDMLSGGRFVYRYFAKKDKKDRVDYILQLLEKNNYEYAKIEKGKVCKELFWEQNVTKSIIVKGKPSKDYAKEIREKNHRIAELEKENAFLKKAAAFFAQQTD